MTEDCSKIVDFLNCEYELFENEKSGEKIVERYYELVDIGKNEGFIPLIISVSDTLAEQIEFFCEDYGIIYNKQKVEKRRREIIEEIEENGTKQYEQRRREELKIYLTNEEINGLDMVSEMEPMQKMEQSLKVEASAEMILAKIPAGKPWELPLWVPMGGFNECPSPKDQAAVFKKWYEEYGAVGAAVSCDIWQLVVQRPVKDSKKAVELAKEMFMFCEDIVLQGTQTFAVLAQVILNSKIWFFWWD